MELHLVCDYGFSSFSVQNYYLKILVEFQTLVCSHLNVFSLILSWVGHQSGHSTHLKLHLMLSHFRSITIFLVLINLIPDQIAYYCLLVPLASLQLHLAEWQMLPSSSFQICMVPGRLDMDSGQVHALKVDQLV